MQNVGCFRVLNPGRRERVGVNDASNIITASGGLDLHTSRRDKLSKPRNKLSIYTSNVRRNIVGFRETSREKSPQHGFSQHNFLHADPRTCKLRLIRCYECKILYESPGKRNFRTDYSKDYDRHSLARRRRDYYSGRSSFATGFNIAATFARIRRSLSLSLFFFSFLLTLINNAGMAVS